jgi:mannosyl-glycoprotein endo-beta-N-acetylglucosaminidase
MIDIFCYFSHNLVTIPSLSIINVCKRNGVDIIGTFITEWELGMNDHPRYLSYMTILFIIYVYYIQVLNIVLVCSPIEVLLTL